jgi:hypothetical protein
MPQPLLALWQPLPAQAVCREMGVQQVLELVQTWPVEQSLAARQGTQEPVPVLHFLLVALLARHWASVVHAEQALFTHTGAVAEEQSELAVQFTHAPSLRHSSVEGLLAAHSASPVAIGLWVQPRHALL